MQKALGFSVKGRSKVIDRINKNFKKSPILTIYFKYEIGMVVFNFMKTKTKQQKKDYMETKNYEKF